MPFPPTHFILISETCLFHPSLLLLKAPPQSRSSAMIIVFPPLPLYVLLSSPIDPQSDSQGVPLHHQPPESQFFSHCHRLYAGSHLSRSCIGHKVIRVSTGCQNIPLIVSKYSSSH